MILISLDAIFFFFYIQLYVLLVWHVYLRQRCNISFSSFCHSFVLLDFIDSSCVCCTIQASKVSIITDHVSELLLLNLERKTIFFIGSSNWLASYHLQVLVSDVNMTAQTCIHVACLMAGRHGDVKLVLLPYYLPPNKYYL